MMKTRLRLGAVLHFIISIGHLACLFFLEEAFKAYDILDEMTSLCCGQTWLLYANDSTCLGFCSCWLLCTVCLGRHQAYALTAVCHNCNCGCIFLENCGRSWILSLAFFLSWTILFIDACLIGVVLFAWHLYKQQEVKERIYIVTDNKTHPYVLNIDL